MTSRGVLVALAAVCLAALGGCSSSPTGSASTTAAVTTSSPVASMSSPATHGAQTVAEACSVYEASVSAILESPELATMSQDTGEARALRAKLSTLLHAATAEVSNAKLLPLLRRADTSAAKLVDTYDAAIGLEGPNLKRLLLAMQDLDQLCG